MMSDCIEWDKYRQEDGYGVLFRKKRSWLAHRYAWFKANGPIPEGMHVLHKCDNPPCVNINHLFLGTNADNVADKIAKGRGAKVQGSQQGNAKLTETDIPRIHYMLGMGYMQSEIARLFGVNRSTIYKIHSRKSWLHVKEI